VLEAVMKYAEQFDKKKQDEVLTLLLPYVRFVAISAQFLEKIASDERVKDLPILHTLLHETYRYKFFPDPSTFNAERMKPRSGGGFRFDPEKCHAQVVISEDGTKAQSNNTTGAWINVRCQTPLNPMNNYCEFKMGHTGLIMMGVVDGDCTRTSYAGQFNNGWTYYSTGDVYHNGTTVVSGAGNNYVSGDKIGMSVDFDRGTLSFYKGGRVSATVNNIPKNSEIYPIACFYTNQGDNVTIESYPENPTIPEIARKEKKAKVAKWQPSTPLSGMINSTAVTTPIPATTTEKKASFVQNILKFRG